MISIPVTTLPVRRAKHDFYEHMGILLLDRLDEQAVNPRMTRFLDLIERHLPEILKGKPDRLITISNRLNPILAQPVNADYAAAIEYIFNYKWFTQKTKERYNAYDLAAALDINVCVYCNRNYTHTVISRAGRKITRPTFDHFFNKAAHPVLALSFYNLIPSCAICNSGVKHEASFMLGTHYHPYLDDYINDFVFSYKPSDKTRSGYEILVKPVGAKTTQTLKDLATELIYNSHTQELREMLDMRYKFSDNYLSILHDKVLTGVRMSPAELYRIAFGAEMETPKFGQRPFSKFKNDLLKELGIVK
jgi:hypothetical protein